MYYEKTQVTILGNGQWKIGCITISSIILHFTVVVHRRLKYLIVSIAIKPFYPLRIEGLQSIFLNSLLAFIALLAAQSCA